MEEKKIKMKNNPYFIAKSCRNGCQKYIISCLMYIISHGAAPMPNCQTMAHDALPAIHKRKAGIVQWLQHRTWDQDCRFDPAGGRILFSRVSFLC